METQLNEAIKPLFDEYFHLTGITEYGISWSDLMSGQAEVPNYGARFDLAFEGALTGDLVNGKIRGVDFLEIRADGRFMLNIQATIITEDGESISLREEGILKPNGNGTPSGLFLNMKFNTHSDRYGWLNTANVWGIGEVDNNTGEGKVKAFVS